MILFTGTDWGNYLLTRTQDPTTIGLSVTSFQADSGEHSWKKCEVNPIKSDFIWLVEELACNTDVEHISD